MYYIRIFKPIYFHILIKIAIFISPFTLIYQRFQRRSDLEEEPQVNAAGAFDVDPEMFKDIARKIGVEV